VHCYPLLGDNRPLDIFGLLLRDNRCYVSRSLQHMRQGLVDHQEGATEVHTVNSLVVGGGVVEDGCIGGANDSRAVAHDLG
jgi:hypothetical protein